MYTPRTLPGFVDVTSSEGLGAGRLLLSLQDGPPTSLSLPAPAPASPSATPAAAEEKPTIGIFGPSSSASSRSAALQSSLESKLRARLDSAGSMEYTLTWKMRTTPSGRRIYARRASRRPKSASAYSGWGSPRASEIGRRRSPEAIAKARERGGSVSLEDQVHLLGTGGPLEHARMAGYDVLVLNPGFSRWLMGFPERWDLLSPGYAEWLQWQNATCAADSRGTATQ